MKLSDPSCAMGGSSHSEYVTAFATATEHATTASPAFGSACSESMLERTESGKGRSVEELIDHSKSHWSQVESDSDEDEVAEISNVKVFRRLQMHSKWGPFFCTLGEGEGRSALELGEKFAEGGQAELYHAHVKWANPLLNEEVLKSGYKFALKVFN